MSVDDAQPNAESSSSGHDFHKKMLRPGHACHHCGESLWGASAACRACKFVAHERCSEGAVTPCSRVAIDYVTNPVPHTWSLQQKFRKKFCNVCRRKMDDRLGVRCVICKYYAHKRCVAVSLPICRRSADYTTTVTPDSFTETRHQWLEGNLKTSDKCAVCGQVCGSCDCLCGQRCLWCRMTVHSSCLSKLAEQRCTAGPLHNLLLPSYAVFRPYMPGADISLPLAAGENASSMLLAENNLLGYMLHGNLGSESDTASIAESVNSDVISQSSSAVTLKVYDSSVDRYKKITVSSDASPAEMLAASQQKFNVHPDDGAKFCLSLETAPNTYESVCKYASALEADGDKLVFRSAENHMSHIRVHYAIDQWKHQHRMIAVSPLTTSDEVVSLAIDALGLILDDAQRQEYVLVECNMYDGLKERVLDRNEKPWKVMGDFANVSVEQLHMVRLYIRHLQTDTPATFYVGNLPVGWERDKLVQSLTQAMGSSNMNYITFGPAFPPLGAIFMFISEPSTARHVFGVLQQPSVQVGGKRPEVMLLPTLCADVLPPDSNPLLTFVNERSGGGQGSEVMTQLVRMLNQHQIFNLSHGGPLPGLFAIRQVKSFRVLICGGDGTVGWVLGQLDAMLEHMVCKKPSVALLPVGTGNDLARVLRWGAGFSGESPLSLLDVLEDCLVVPLDRWNITFEVGSDAAPVATTNTNNSPAQSSYVMNNYLGIGIEAEIALKFHLAREENPEKFNSRLHNKGVYLKMSIGKMMQRTVNSDSSKDLSKAVTLDVDGERIKIPSGVEGIIVLNIKSWMAGCDGWGTEKDDKFKPPSMNDGLLEIIGVQGVMHLGQIQGGMRGGIRLAQGSDITFQFSAPIPVEIDGEPFRQPAGICHVLQGSTVQMLRRHKRSVIAAPPGLG
eukprot:scpid36203/ scgid2956/ Diacylglycerol kinase theta; Diglyceride kinase theta